MTTHRRITIKKTLPLVAIGLSVGLAAGCSGSSSSVTAGASSTPVASTPAGATTPAPTGGTIRVLPVGTNPITNSATAPGLTITKALVENRLDVVKALAAGAEYHASERARDHDAP